jgi:hypothetical protein
MYSNSAVGHVLLVSGSKTTQAKETGDLPGSLTPEVGKSTTPDEVVAETGQFR